MSEQDKAKQKAAHDCPSDYGLNNNGCTLNCTECWESAIEEVKSE